MSGEEKLIGSNGGGGDGKEFLSVNNTEVNSSPYTLKEVSDDNSHKNSAPSRSAPAAKALGLTWVLFQGSFLPMFSDKVRNSVRSRALLVLTYVLAATIVGGFIVATYYVQETESLSFEFTVPPPKTFQPGVTLPPIVAQITDSKGQGVAGRRAFLSITPIDPIKIVPIIDGRSVKLSDDLDFQCTSTMMFPETRGFNWKLPYCSPQSADPPILRGRLTTTDADGYAQFDNAAVATCVRGSYLMIVGLLKDDNVASPDFSLNAYISCTPALLDISAVDVRLNSTTFESIPLPSYGYAPGREHEQIPVDADLTYEAKESAVYTNWKQGKSAIEATINVTWLSERTPEAIAGHVVPLPLQGNPLPRTNAVQYLPPDTIVKDAFFAGMIGYSTDIRPLGDNKFTALLNFTIYLSAATSQQMFVGVCVLGTTIPLFSSRFHQELLTPTTLALPYLAIPSSPINVKVVSVPDSIRLNGSAFETEVLPFKVKVTNAITGQPEYPNAFRYVYALLRPSANNTNVIGGDANFHPGVFEKRFAFDVVAVDGDGIAEFVGLRTSSDGGVGLYDIVFVCDGVQATFDGFADENFITVDVQSFIDPTRCMVDKFFLNSCRPEDYSTCFVMVGNYWAMMPETTIVSRTGIPIPGKELTVQAANASDIVVVSGGSASDDNGVVQMYELRVLAMGGAAHGKVRVVDFLLISDGLVVGRFSRPVLQWSVPEHSTAVVIESLPTRCMSGRSYDVFFRVVDGYHNPVPNAEFNMSISTKFFKAPPGQEQVVLHFTTGPTGVTSFPTSFLASVSHFTIKANVYPVMPGNTLTANGVRNQNAMALTYISVIKSISGNFVSQFGVEPYMNVTIDAHWDYVSPTYPLPVTGIVVWQPEYIARGNLPRTTSTHVKSSSQSNVKLYLNHSTAKLPGIYALVTYVAGNMYMPAAVTMLPAYPGFPQYVMRVEHSLFDPVTGAWGTVGEVFPRQPTVSIINPQTGQRVSSPQVSAQLGIVNTGENGEETVTWVRPSTDAMASIRHGMLVRISENRNDMLGLNLAPAITDCNPTCSFTQLYLVGGAPGAKFKVRYCFAQETLAYNYTSGREYETDLCVVDNGTITVSPLQASSVVLPSSLTQVGVPATSGTPLPTISATLFNGVDKVPMKAGLCMVEEVDGQSMLEFAEFVIGGPGSPIRPDSTGSGQFAISRNSSQVVFQGISVSKTAPAGVFRIRLVCIGVVSPEISIVVSNEPGQLSFVGDVPSWITVQRQVGFNVLLTSAALTPLIDGVAFTVKPRDKDCERESCGMLSPDSMAFSSTHGNGVAGFLFSFVAGETGNYTFEVKVADLLSPQSTLQNVQNQLHFVHQAVGLPRKQYKEFVQTTKISKYAWANSFFVAVVTELESVLEVLIEKSRQDIRRDSKSSDKNILRTLFTGKKPVVATYPFEIWNPCARTDILRQPQLSLTFPNVPISSSLFVPYVIGRFDMQSAPKLAFIGDNGKQFNITDLAGVYVTVLPEGGGGRVSQLNQNEWVIENNNVLVLNGLELYFGKKGSYSLSVSYRGGGMNFTNIIEVKPATALTLSEAMRYSAFIIALILSPLLCASVPHARPAFSIAACFLGMIILGTAVFLLDTYMKDIENVYIRAYLIIVTVLCVGVGLGQITVGVVTGLSRKQAPWALKLRGVNDVGRATAVLEYAMWITNVRVDEQEPEEPKEGLKEKLNSAVGSVVERKDMVESKIREKAQRLSDYAEVGVNVESGSPLKRRVNDTERKPLNYKNAPKVAFIPINYLVVCGITAVLVALVTLLLVYIHAKLDDGLSELISALPSPDVNITTVERGGTFFVDIAKESLSAAVKEYPQYAFLEKWMGRIDGKAVIAFLSDLQGYMGHLVDRLSLVFIISCCIANTVVVACLVSHWLVIPEMINDIRRGIDKRTATAAPAEGYIGLHCFHMIIMHQLVFWPVSVGLFIILIKPVFLFVWHQLQLIIVASISSLIVQFVLQKFIVGLLLTEGWSILRPEYYSVWHFVGLILGVFTGLAKSISRYVQGIVYITILFARLDFTIFPAMFASMDIAAKGFFSVVCVEAKTNNPIYLTFNAVLLVERHLARIAAQQLADGVLKPQADVDTPLVDPQINAAVMKNIGACLLRDWNNCSRDLRTQPAYPLMDLHEYVDPVRRTTLERVRNRWWLLWLLHANPSLRKLRKHHLFEELEAEQSGMTPMVSFNQPRTESDVDCSAADEAPAPAN